MQTALERNRKKLSLQEKQMKDTAKKEKYKVYGELINTYGYGLEDGCKSFKALNYYTNEEITIPLDPTMTPAENSKKYFDKYGKLKRTEEALTEQIADTRSEIEHLESVSNALDIALAESDLAQIKEELMEYGYIKKHYDRRKGQKAQSNIVNGDHHQQQAGQGAACLVLLDHHQGGGRGCGRGDGTQRDGRCH